MKNFPFLRSIFKRKYVLTVNKTTSSQNVTRRRKSSTSIHPNPDVGQGISREESNGTCIFTCSFPGVPNDFVTFAFDFPSRRLLKMSDMGH